MADIKRDVGCRARAERRQVTDSPDPLTPPECDLRGMPYMPLDIVRLFDSDLYALSTGDEFKAALTLWGKAFLQIPAGSLPKDERILAHLSGAGPGWKKVRDMALRGWAECSDGRLYHPVVAEKAHEAWKARVARNARTEAARQAKLQQKLNGGSAPPVTGSVTENATEHATEDVTGNVTTLVAESVTGSKGSTRESEGKEGRKKEPFASLRPVEPVQPDARALLFSEGVATVRAMTGKPDKHVRSLIGLMLKNRRDDCAATLAAIHEGAELRPADPVAWLLGPRRRRSANDKIREDWNLSTFADPAALEAVEELEREGRFH